MAKSPRKNLKANARGPGLRAESNAERSAARSLSNTARSTTGSTSKKASSAAQRLYTSSDAKLSKTHKRGDVAPHLLERKKKK